MRSFSMPRMPYIAIRVFVVLALALSASAQQNTEPVDYVNPNPTFYTRAIGWQRSLDLLGF